MYQYWIGFYSEKSSSLSVFFHFHKLIFNENFYVDFHICCYRPQTKFAKVMFLQVSVILSGGGVRGCSRGACVVARGGMRDWSGGDMRGFFDEIQSMSGRYASYWNAFLFVICSVLDVIFVVHTFIFENVLIL